jgi:hypothetical protein
MELEFWSVISQAICDVQRLIKPNPRDSHSTALIARVHIWSALHDRPTSWACDKKNWTTHACPKTLPDQSTMSRRMRRDDFAPFLHRLQQRLNGKIDHHLLKIIDGKPLELPNHTRDPDAGWGRGVSRLSIGYKLHMIHSGNPLPDAFVVTPLDGCEKQMARRMIGRVKGPGYLLADAHYDASWLFDLCHHHQHQLVCPRAKPGTGLGHHYQSPRRVRTIELLEPPGAINPFGPSLYGMRTGIERQFSQLVSFGGGLAALPTWVRRIWRVRNWVWAKLLINAARIRINRKRRVDA